MANEGVEFLLELNAKLDGAVKMVRALERVEAEVKKTDTELKKSEIRVGVWGKLFQNQTELARRSWSRFSEHLGSLAAWDIIKGGFDLVRRGVGAVVDLGMEMLTTAAAAERTEMAFVNMLGPDAGRGTLDYLDALQHNTEFTGGALKGLTTSLLDAGFAGGEFKRAVAVALDVAARSTNKMTGFGQAVSVLERVKLGGRIDDRGLRALGLRGKDFFAQMSKDLGIGQKELQKKLAAGKIKTDDILNSISNAMAKKSGRAVGAVGADMASLLGARLEKLKGAGNDLFEGLFKTEGYQRLSDQLGVLSSDLAPDGLIGSRIAVALEDTFSRVATSLTTFDWQTAGMMLADGLELALDVAEGLVSAFSQMTDAVNVISDGLESFWTLGHLTDRLGITNIGDRKERERRERVADPAVLRTKAEGERLRGVLRRERASGFAGASILQPTATPGADMFGLPFNMFAGLKRGAGGAYDVGKGNMEAMVDGAKDGLGVHSPSREFEKIGRSSVDGFERGLAIRPPSMATREFLDGAAPAGMGPVSISVPISINVAGSSSSAEEIAQEIGKIDIGREIVAALEQLGLQGGYA